MDRLAKDVSSLVLCMEDQKAARVIIGGLLFGDWALEIQIFEKTEIP